MFKIAVLVSGGGTDLQSIIDSVKSGYLNCNIAVVIGDRKCHGVQRSIDQGIKGVFLDRKIYKDTLCDEIDKVISAEKVDLVVLAGFLSIIDKKFVEKWHGKIINIHPSLLPKFGGKGMYGINVHKAVIEAGEKESGCTVHYVDTGIDSGKMILQKKVPVLPGDTPEILQKRILEEEHKILPEAIYKIANKLIKY